MELPLSGTVKAYWIKATENASVCCFNIGWKNRVGTHGKETVANICEFHLNWHIAHSEDKKNWVQTDNAAIHSDQGDCLIVND